MACLMQGCQTNRDLKGNHWVSKMKRNQSAGRRLASNALMLYILTFSNYALFLITIPYQTRILGPGLFGHIGFATAFAAYFQLVVEFGFMILATELVSKHRDDKNQLSLILSTVTWCKIGLAIVSAVVLGLLCIFVEPFRQDPLLYALFFVSGVLAAFVPDFIYRGLENMRVITIRTVIIRLFFTLMIFALLKTKADYYWIPVLGIIGNIGALIAVGWDLASKDIRVHKTSFRQTASMLKQSSQFFYSRVATNIYSATNTFVLGILYGPASVLVGFYASADKLVVAAKQGIIPVIDSVYPYMVRHKDFRLIRKLLTIGLPILAGGCLVVAIFAESICALIFGEDFREAGQYLRLLTPVILLAFPGMLFGFPVLSPLGLSKYANMSNVFGAVLQVLQLTILFSIGRLSIVTICIATVVTELATLSFRLVIVWRYRHLINANNTR